MLLMLVEFGSAFDIVDKNGDTAVGAAILCGRKENAEYLLSLGAPLGDTALVCAVYGYAYRQRYYEEENLYLLLDFVLSIDPSMNNTRNGLTTLSFAAYCSDIDMLTFLVRKGAALDIMDENGDTAVARAMLGGNKENAEYLLSLGAPLGETALVCAVLAEEGNIR